LLENLKEILIELPKIRKKVINIDFDSLLISDLNSENIIYSKKFLSDSLIAFIFN
jgi:hypothetical protein